MDSPAMPLEPVPEIDAFEYRWMYDEDIECFWTNTEKEDERRDT